MWVWCVRKFGRSCAPKKRVGNCPARCDKLGPLWEKCLKIRCWPGPRQGGGTGDPKRDCIENPAEGCLLKQCCLDKKLFCTAKENTEGKKVHLCLKVKDIDAGCSLREGGACPCCPGFKCIKDRCTACTSKRGIEVDEPCCPPLMYQKQARVCYPRKCKKDRDCGPVAGPRPNFCRKNKCQQKDQTCSGLDCQQCISEAGGKCWSRECCPEKNLLCTEKQDTQGRKVPLCLRQEDIDGDCTFNMGSDCPLNNCCPPLKCISGKCM